MNHVSRTGEAMFRPEKQPITLRENQIIQGKITKIHPNNKAEIQIGNHKLVAEILTPLSIGKQYFFQVQAADHIQLKVFETRGNEQVQTHLESLLQQLGLRISKANLSLIKELIQEKIPFNREQLHQAFSLLAQAGDKAETREIVKAMITAKLPMTSSVFQAVQATRQDSMTGLLKEVYTQLAQQPSLSEQEQKLMNKLETLLVRPASPEQPAVVKQLISQFSAAPEFLQALKALGLTNTAVSQGQWTEKVNQALSADRQMPGQAMSMPEIVHVPENEKEAAQLTKVLEALTANSDDIRKAAVRIKTIFAGLQTASLSNEQIMQVRQMMERDLFPLLPKETVQMIEHAWSRSQASLSETGTALEQQVTAQLLEVFSRESTFQQLATIAAMDTAEEDGSFSRQPLPEQFLTHLRIYLQSIGMNEEFALKKSLEYPEQLKAVTDNPSVKSMLLGLIQQHDQGLGERAQTLVHFINGMQMQSVTEVGNLLQASFILPGEKLALNQDIFMQFEGQKDEKGQIDADHCRIMFVLDLANIKETMIDMNVQKRIISVTVYNEHQVPPVISTLQPILKEALEKLDYQLSAVKWKPLYEEKVPHNHAASEKRQDEKQERERYDFLI